METLAVYSADHKLQPLLAEKWENMGPKTWRLTLRKGVKFHNGEEFNSDSVKASVEIFNSSKGLAGTFFKFITEVKPVDSYTVDLITDTPNPVVPLTLAFLYAYPPKHAKEVGVGELGTKPVGTGPYKFVEWVKGDYIKLKANPDYRNGAPKIDEIIFRQAGEASTRVAMLETGKADLIMNVPPQMIDRIEKSGTRAESVQSNRRVFVQFNFSDPILKDVRLRKALSYATDADAIIKSVFSGRAYRVKTILFPGMIGYAPDKATTYDFDLAKAKALMKEAGYPNGFETELNVGVGRLTLDKELAEALVGQWEKAGIKVKLNVKEWATFVSEAFKHQLPGMHIISHAPMWWDPDYVFQNHFWTKAMWHYVATPKGDEFFSAQRSEMDPNKREAIVRQAEDYWLDQAPWIILYDQQDIYGVSKRLQWKPRPDELMKFDEATLSS
jgi:peptide/nickel transport system substrate-binding protein